MRTEFYTREPEQPDAADPRLIFISSSANPSLRLTSSSTHELTLRLYPAAGSAPPRPLLKMAKISTTPPPPPLQPFTNDPTTSRDPAQTSRSRISATSFSEKFIFETPRPLRELRAEGGDSSELGRHRRVWEWESGVGGAAETWNDFKTRSLGSE
jgi:hypothetical protein